VPFGFLTPEDGTDRFAKTAVRNYHYWLRNNPEERSSHPLRGGSMKSHMGFIPIYIGYCLFNLLAPEFDI
jgi:hypothetical protein